jgi:ferrous iron transport protein B
MTSGPLTIALLGNPNVGKSTLFTALAGIPTRVGNYPGVTVEEKVGRFEHRGTAVDLVDLPGTYSLVPQGPDERVAVDVLHGRIGGVPRPDCILVVADATNLERNLFLTTQALEVGLPVVVALSLIDVADRRGITIDVGELSRRLGCPVVRVAPPTGEGLAELRDRLLEAVVAGPPRPIPITVADTGSGRHPAASEAIARYAAIENLLAGVVRGVQEARRAEDRIDAVLTHPLWGTAIFAAVMLSMFAAIFWVAPPLMDLISAVMDRVGEGVARLLPAGPIRSLVIDGILAGVAGSVVFVPQIALLFLFIAILEGCGYLARAAHLMDRLLIGVGLSGKSFIPLLSSFACAIPGIMAARTIENRRDRLLTILVAPLMSCSARLPVYLLLCGAFVPDRAAGLPWLPLKATVLAALYALGVAVAAGIATLLSRTVFRGPPPPFVMELPAWRWPRPAVVLERAREAAWSFLTNAGTLIVAISVVLWALMYYPRDERAVEADVATLRSSLVARAADRGTDAADRTDALAQLAALDTPEGLAAARQGAAQRHSFLGRAGRMIEPVVRPLGWDWRIGCAALAVVLATMGVIYNLGDVDTGDADGATALERRLRAARWDGTTRPVFTLPVALSIMVFFALCAQCASTLVVIGRETGSWIWPVVTFVYMTGLAWLGAFAIYQLGTRLGW